MNKDAQVIQIGEQIKKHRSLENKENMTNLAVAIANVDYEGKSKNFGLQTAKIKVAIA